MKEDQIPAKDWLNTKAQQAEECDTSGIRLPVKNNGEYYEIKDLYDDQKFVVETIMKKLREWVETDDLSKFQPLRLTINGKGGSGKSVIIDTIVTAIRRMFHRNDVVQVAAPTGTAAFNVGGKTLHNLMHMGVDKFDYKAESLSETARARLVKDFGSLLALIIDERSLISSKDLGTAETMMSETIFRGGLLRQLSFGGLPVVVLAGDDYQLPATSSGAIDVLGGKTGTKIVMNGRKIFRDCAEHVIELTSSKRIRADKLIDQEIIKKLRTREKLSEPEVEKLLSLHIDAISKNHPKEIVQEIRSRAMYLFFRNEPRIRHNLEQLNRVHSKESPVGFFRCKATGNVGGKAVNNHFNGDPPGSSIFCKDSQVALDGRNFFPEWGLHNSACGRVDEIVFAKDENPNLGHLPEYVVVDFPVYCGPAWDEDNPTVRLLLYYKRNITHEEEEWLTGKKYDFYTIFVWTITACPDPTGDYRMQERKRLLYETLRPFGTGLWTNNSQISGTKRWSSG